MGRLWGNHEVGSLAGHGQAANPLILLSTFISLLIATAYAQSPSPEEYLHLYAAPAVMIDIVRCESNFKQFNDDGSILKDSTYGTHVGLFQIWNKYSADAVKRGDDIYTPEGNIKYALYLYKKNGTRDWNASKWCWGGTSPPLQG